MNALPSRTAAPLIICWLAWLALCAGSVQAFAAEGRVALVIGNAAYSQKPLKNPVNDAEDLAATLKDLGFEVLLRKNRSEEQMKQDLVDFQDRLERSKGVGLFYFSGHGMQAGRGRNYLLPVGREYRRERDVETFGVDAGLVLARMEEAGSALNIVILDACRDSPLPAESRSAGSRGLGRMEAPSGSLIAFATAPRSIADDNAAGRNGLYTKHLISALRATGLRLEDVFKQVGREVEKESGGRQSPEEVSKLRDIKPFYFTPRPGIPSFDLGDLEEQRQVRAEWTVWQARMQADYERVAVFKDTPEQQLKAWERFLSAYAGDNPYSGNDERLRELARQRKAEAEGRLAAHAEPVAERARDVFFEFDKCVLLPQAKAELDHLSERIGAINLVVLMAVGHSSVDEGTDKTAVRISECRSAAVKDYLTRKGIMPNRIYTEGQGSTQPVADNATAEGRAKNRRVAIEVVGTRRDR